MTATGTVVVVNDAHLVLAAQRLEDGVALVAGTGSIASAVSQDERNEPVVGGTSSATRAAATGSSGRRFGKSRGGKTPTRPSELLGVALMDATGEGDLATVMQRFYESAQPDKWARHAELVLADARRLERTAIRAAAAGALATIAVAVIERLEAPEALPVVLAGGLLVGSHPLAALTRCAIETAVPGTPVLTASEPPVAGAVHLALAAAG